MSDPKNGPAFPCPMGGDWPECDRGMTLRDYFAGCALNQRKALSLGGWYADDAAREAYQIADAMLKAREA